MERIEIIRDLRLGTFDVLIGINLLREGLDIPEVSLVAVLDADKEGFLRSNRSLVQTCGRAARNVNGKVLLYGDTVTESMQYAMNETARRRAIQQKYNDDHGITPETVQKEILSSFGNLYSFDSDQTISNVAEKVADYGTLDNLPDIIHNLEIEMRQAAKELAFEKAAKLRDRIKELKQISLM
jgi:excinuclease ABC subunit B